MSAASYRPPVPCDEVRPLFYEPHCCANCGVLVELHAEEGWRAHFETRASLCDRLAEQADQRASELRAGAEEYRSLPFTTRQVTR